MLRCLQRRSGATLQLLVAVKGRSFGMSDVRCVDDTTKFFQFYKFFLVY